MNRDTNNTLVKVFHDVDGMLVDIEEIILESRSHSPFNEYLTQLSADQTRAVSNGIAELRAGMICILRLHGIVTNNPTIQTTCAVRQIAADAASRFDELVTHAADTPLGGIESETYKLLLQMQDALRHMRRALLSPQESHQEGG